MCSNACDCSDVTKDISNNLSLAETNNSQPTKCRKCGCQPFIALDKILVECKQCFLESCGKKFRTAIGKSGLNKTNYPILVAYSGGPSSSALLDLIQSVLDSDNRRRQKFTPSILHVDTQLVLSQGDLGLTQQERLVRLKGILDNVHNTHPTWPLYYTTLEMCNVEENSDEPSTTPLYHKYDPSDDIRLCGGDSITARQKSLLDKIKSLDLTDRQQFVEDGCNHLIVHVASQINSSFTRSEDCFKYLFKGNNATQLANNLLVDVILGRGSTIGACVSICDNRFSIPVVRPMRDFSKKEIAFYVLAKNIKSFLEPNLVTFAEPKSSIQTATESFLSKLYDDYPSTYNTLLRTGDKMLN